MPRSFTDRGFLQQIGALIRVPQFAVIIPPGFAICQRSSRHFDRFLPFIQGRFGYFMQYCVLQIAEYMIS